MLATIIQASGIAVFALGIGLWFPPAGVAVLGAGVVLFGIAMERGK
jgi:hypothetical protein